MIIVTIVAVMEMDKMMVMIMLRINLILQRNKRKT